MSPDNAPPPPPPADDPPPERQRHMVASMGPDLLAQADPPDLWPVDVFGCASCAQNHPKVPFKRFKRAAADYWAPCPNTGEPILLRVIRPDPMPH